MERVLIVEDDENIRQLLKLTLASFNYELVDFENGKDAYDYLQDSKVDLAILDLMLPGMNGYDILKFIRSKASLKDLPVIILSAKDKELDKIIVDFIDINGNDNPKSKKNFKTAKEAVTWYKEILREIQKKNPIVETRYTQREHIYNSTTAWVDQDKSMAYKVLLHMEPEYYYVETFKFKYSIE